MGWIIESLADFEYKANIVLALTECPTCGQSHARLFLAMPQDEHVVKTVEGCGCEIVIGPLDRVSISFK